MKNPIENFKNPEKDFIKKYKDYFLNVRHDFIDDLSPSRLMSNDKNYHKYKCRGNCFVGVASRISRLIRKGVIQDQKIVNQGEDFIQYVKERDFSKFSTKEDIDKINAILDIMIEELP